MNKWTTKAVKRTREHEWRRQNRKFIDSYNAYIHRNGVFGEEFQDWDEPSVSRQSGQK